MNHQSDDRLETAFDAARTAAQHVPAADRVAQARAQFLSEARSVSLDEVVRHREQGSALPDLTLIEGERRMNRFYSRTTRLVATVIFGVIVAGGFWTSPSLRALAQSVIDFFIPAASDSQQTVIYSGPEAPRPAPAQADSLYGLTVEEAAARADFAIRVPTFVPPAYTLEGAEYQPDKQLVSLHYTCDGLYPLAILEQKADEPVPAMEVGASAVIVDVPIRDTVGQYVRGAWDYQLDDPNHQEQVISKDAIQLTRVWTNNADWQQLVWREDGINFTVASGGSIGDQVKTHCALDEQDFAGVAQSLQLVDAAK